MRWRSQFPLTQELLDDVVIKTSFAERAIEKEIAIMPYDVERRDGKFRIIHAAGPNKGDIAENDAGTPLDGGGHATRAEAERQVRGIEWNEHKSFQGRYGVERR